VKAKFASVRGTSDFNALESLRFSKLTSQARSILEVFGYQELILPILEESELFIKGVGSTSDIVERQMFKIEGKDIVLRPEGTAQVIRYYIQYALNRQSDFHKFFYIGPMFRGERPQKGRFRQFHHIGVEAIGSSNVYLDAEVLMLALELLDKIGIQEKVLKINTLGCSDDKKAFEKYLFEKLSSKKGSLCENCSRRLIQNPLRVIDCKHRQCKQVVDALDIKDSHICQTCKDDFKKLLSILSDCGVSYVHDYKLVRGLDYYTNTVFEVTSPLLGAQDAIGAGGRYNNLIKSLGGPDMPAIGFALGVERILLALGETEDARSIDVFIAVTSLELQGACFSILKELRANSFKTDCDYVDKSLKAQMRAAQKRGAKFVVIVGDEELDKGEVVIKDMQASTQSSIPIKGLLEFLLERCK
jgi:histidyl-tRNA synthetase